MVDLVYLTLRHVKVFLRDKAAVFFSFLSVIILLGLYFLFIGRQYTTGDGFETISSDLKTFLSVGVIMGGVLVINTVSLSLGVMGSIVTDLESRKLEGFLVTPVKRYKIVLSYYISAIIVTFTLTFFMWVLTFLYVGFTSGYFYNFEAFMLTTLLILLYTIMSSSFMLYMVTLIKSTNAFGALAGVLGTVIGFISGIYMPLIALGDSMTKVASLVPFTHMTILLKQVLLKQAYQLIPGAMKDAIEPFYGTYDLPVFGISMSLSIILMISLGLSFILLALAYKNMTKKMIK